MAVGAYRKQPITMPKPQNLNIKTAEESVVAAILADEGAMKVLVELIEPDYFADPICNAIAQAAWVCFGDDEVVTDARILDLLHRMDLLSVLGPNPDAVVSKLNAAGFPSVVRQAPKHAELIRDRGVRRLGIQNLEQIIKDLQQPAANLAETLRKMEIQIDALQGRLYTEEAHGIAVALDESQDLARMPSVSTKLRWLDVACNGWHQNKVVGLQGEFKGRKTSFFMNLLLHLITNPKKQDRKNFSVFTVDDDRAIFALQLKAMWATMYIIRKRKIRLEDLEGNPNGYPELNLNADILLYPGEMFTAMQREALEHADRGLRAADDHLRVYDLRQFDGEADKVIDRIQRDVRNHGCDNYAIDFIGDLTLGSNSVFRKRGSSHLEEFNTIVRQLKLVTRKHRLTGIWLMQKNAAAMAGKQGGGTGTMNGVAGPAACDILLETEKPGNQHITVRILKARRLQESQMHYLVSPYSGLIVNYEAMPAPADTQAY